MKATLAKNGSICARRKRPANNDLTGRINAVNSKNALGQIEVDRSNLHDGWLPFARERLIAFTPWHLDAVSGSHLPHLLCPPCCDFGTGERATAFRSGRDMKEPRQDAEEPLHDRALLLHGRKRNKVLTLEEVQRYGSDSFSDPDYIRLYGMTPPQWYVRGVRLLGRTAVECTRDPLADRIGRDVAAVAASLPPETRCVVVDPFAGSCNTLYWILQHVSLSRGIAFEFDLKVPRLSSASIAATPFGPGAISVTMSTRSSPGRGGCSPGSAATRTRAGARATSFVTARLTANVYCSG
jgi:hypothetical protein